MISKVYENYFNIIYALIIASMIIIFSTIGITDPNALIATISGYALSICSIVILVGLVYNNITISNPSIGWIRLFISLFPFISLLLILSVSLSLVSIYFDRISSHKVSDYYYNFSKVSIIFIIAQLVILFSGLMGSKDSNDIGLITQKTASVLMLMSVINMLLIITLGITLKYYSTDG